MARSGANSPSQSGNTRLTLFDGEVATGVLVQSKAAARHTKAPRGPGHPRGDILGRAGLGTVEKGDGH